MADLETSASAETNDQLLSVPKTLSRDLNKGDLPRLRELVSGYDYKIPNLDKFLETFAIVEDGEVKVAVAARPTVELYLFCDPNWETPGMREQALKIVHENMRMRLMARGIEDAHAWVPPKFEKSLGRRLMKLFPRHWVKSTWTCFTAFVRPIGED
jgi:hypothetical protein